MMTTDDIKRLSHKCAGVTFLDTDLKPEVLKGNLDACVEQLRTHLKRVKKGGTLAVFWSETR